MLGACSGRCDPAREAFRDPVPVNADLTAGPLVSVLACPLRNDAGTPIGVVTAPIEIAISTIVRAETPLREDASARSG